MPSWSLPGLEALAPIGLAELRAAADLQDRVDRKYIVPVAVVAALAERLAATHVVLEHEKLRAFRYRSAYFDTADLRSFRDRLQGRRRRFKCRARTYVDSGACMFEVKLKGACGRTVKHRLACERPQLSAPALAFLRARLLEAYGVAPAGPLGETLAVTCTRVTLAAPALAERVTCDLDLAFAAPGGARARLMAATAIVETKSAHGRALADRELRALGARPEPACSKYCLGIGAVRADVKHNLLRPLLRRHVTLLAPGASRHERSRLSA